MKRSGLAGPFFVDVQERKGGRSRLC